MQKKPSLLVQGERARLFPVLSDSSKEGRATAIFLACLSNVDEFANALLSSVGRPIGVLSRVRTFTEVCFQNEGEPMRGRPDGLIEVRTGKATWYAMVEAKIGNAALGREQIESYLKSAKANDVNAVITISNQFAASPSHHPVDLKLNGRSAVRLYHWSWMHILTVADLLLTNDGVADADQQVILNEFRRFLSHDSTGVKGFERMPRAWPDLVRGLATGERITARSKELREVITAWHQEVRDLGLILSRQTGVGVSARLPRVQTRNSEERLKHDIDQFMDRACLTASLDVPEAAAILEICVDVRTRSVSAGMKLPAPEDRKTSAARIGWLLRQIKVTDVEDIYVRVHWPHRGFEQYSLAELRQDVSPAAHVHADRVPAALEVVLVRTPGPRFLQLRGFLEELEALVPDFYHRIGADLRAWKAAAPRMRDDRIVPEDVSPQGIARDAETAASEDGKGGIWPFRR